MKRLDQKTLAGILAAVFLAACSGSKPDNATPDSLAAGHTDSARLIISPAGFNAPEAVRYDSDQDVYFVTNWGAGDPAAKDNNGYISRMSPEGKVDQPRLIAGGTGGATLVEIWRLPAH